MVGKGLLTGLRFTLRAFFRRKDTLQYPEEKIAMTERYRGGVLALDSGKCIACGLCALACPNAAILVTTEKCADNKKRLAAYRYLSGYCLFCNLCVEACPVKAIAWDQNYEITSYHKEFLNYDCLARAAGREAPPRQPEEGGNAYGG
ncbi:MAG: NADH-quinone oxidoreductase subunit I [Sporomusaceae bacterium]|nr:NADH-quinone oxidoreductase subunit I [Sporomusaceae bacterium]